MTALMRWRPFGEVTSLQREMNDLFDQLVPRGERSESEFWGSANFPATNVSETNDNLIVTAEVPGLEPKDLDISVTEGILTVKGEKRQEKETKEEHFHRVERSYGSFTRAFRLPVGVELDKIAADYKNGVLRITLPKSTEAKRREVKVKVS